MTTPEFNLAVECCRFNFSGNGGHRPVHVSPGIDWRRFLRLVRRHRIEPLAARALQQDHISPPAAIADALAADSVAAAKANLFAARESKRLQAAFSKAQVPLLFVKGLTISALAYGDPLLKMSADVDLLVEPGDLGRAAPILTALQFKLVLPAVEPTSAALSAWHNGCKESVWYNSQSGVTVELHTRLADSPSLIPGFGMQSPRQNVDVGNGISLPTLAREELFAYLCVHGSSSAWFRLKWIADLTGCVQRASPDEIERLYRGALANGAGRAPAQALLLANRLFGLELPAPLLSELRSDKANRALAAIALRELQQDGEPTERALGTAFIHLSQLLLVKGLPFKLSEARRQANAAGGRILSG